MVGGDCVYVSYTLSRVVVQRNHIAQIANANLETKHKKTNLPIDARGYLHHITSHQMVVTNKNLKLKEKKNETKLTLIHATN